MNVKVKLFAAAKELAGTDSVNVDLPDGATVESLKSEMSRLYPELEKVLSFSAVAIDLQIVPDSTPLSPSCELALIPPVSGG